VSFQFNIMLSPLLGMNTTLLFGLVMVGTALFFLISPRLRLLPLVAATLLLGNGVGLLSSVVGFTDTLNILASVDPDEKMVMFFAILFEALNTTVLALLFSVLSSVLVAGGALRYYLSDVPKAAKAAEAEAPSVGVSPAG
jgi:hypothetical protein